MESDTNEPSPLEVDGDTEMDEDGNHAVGPNPQTNFQDSFTQTSMPPQLEEHSTNVGDEFRRGSAKSEHLEEAVSLRQRKKRPSVSSSPEVSPTKIPKTAADLKKQYGGYNDPSAIVSHDVMDTTNGQSNVNTASVSQEIRQMSVDESGRSAALSESSFIKESAPIAKESIIQNNQWLNSILSAPISQSRKFSGESSGRNEMEPLAFVIPSDSSTIPRDDAERNLRYESCGTARTQSENITAKPPYSPTLARSMRAKISVHAVKEQLEQELRTKDSKSDAMSNQILAKPGPSRRSDDVFKIPDVPAYKTPDTPTHKKADSSSPKKVAVSSPKKVAVSSPKKVVVPSHVPMFEANSPMEHVCPEWIFIAFDLFPYLPIPEDQTSGKDGKTATPAFSKDGEISSQISPNDGIKGSDMVTKDDEKCPQTPWKDSEESTPTLPCDNENISIFPIAANYDIISTHLTEILITFIERKCPKSDNKAHIAMAALLRTKFLVIRFTDNVQRLKFSVYKLMGESDVESFPLKDLCRVINGTNLVPTHVLESSSPFILRIILI